MAIQLIIEAVDSGARSHKAWQCWAAVGALCAAGASQPTSSVTGAAKPPVCASTRKRSRQKQSRRLCRCATRPSTPACRPHKLCPAWQTRGSTRPLIRAFKVCSKSMPSATAEAKRSRPRRWLRLKRGWPVGLTRSGAGTSCTCPSRSKGNSCACTWCWTCSAG